MGMYLLKKSNRQRNHSLFNGDKSRNAVVRHDGFGLDLNNQSKQRLQVRGASHAIDGWYWRFEIRRFHHNVR
jgi:hypothetical protein